MRFVYFGYDFLIHAVENLMQQGHELAGIYSFECDNIFNFNEKTAALAQSLNIPYSIKKPLAMDIEAFIVDGVECFFAAGYVHKIPPIDPDKAYSLNLHPSVLPEGRGIMPSPTILMEEPQAAGFTIHKIAPDYDTGDIIAQQKIKLTEADDVETLSAKIVMRAPSVVEDVFANIESYWANATPQNEALASTYPKPDEQMRLLDWTASNAALEKKGRAFGRYGCLGEFDGKIWAIYNFKCWDEAHEYQPGDVACVTAREVVVATRQGFAILKELQSLS